MWLAKPPTSEIDCGAVSDLVSSRRPDSVRDLRQHGRDREDHA